MREGWEPWPVPTAARYRQAGLWAGRTVGDLLRELAASHGGRTALVDGAARWTYADLDAIADRVCAGFAARGVRHGDRVLVQLPNRAEFVHLWLGLARLGAVPVHAMPGHRLTEIRALLSTAEPVAYVVAERVGRVNLRGLAEQACAGLDRPPLLVIVGAHADGSGAEAAGHAGSTGGSTVEGPGRAADVMGWLALLAEGEQAGPPARPAIVGRAPTADDLIALLLSGGTTGTPKLVPRTHDDYLLAARGAAEVCGFGTDTVYLVVLPVGFNFAFSSPGVLGTLVAGGTVVLARDPSPTTTLRLVERERATAVALTPPLVPYWLDEFAISRPDLSSLRLLQVGGARIPDDLAARAEATLGVPVQQVYGMAEGLVCYTRPDDPAELRHTTQGRPMSPADEIVVADEDDRPVPPGEVGELLTRGPCTLRGYYRAEAHNRFAFTADGLLRTGDLVRQLPSGHLQVVGRVKDQVNKGGEKIAAVEVEEHLRAYPHVVDAALVAAPDPKWGECPVAFLVCDGPPPTARDVAAFLRERGLAAYKAPERVRVVDALPLTAVGKVDKRSLAATASAPEATMTALPETPAASVARGWADR